MEVIKDKLNIENLIDIDRGHCMGKHQDSRPWAIIFKLSKFKGKQKILRNVKKLKKNTGIYIYEDFCNDTLALRKSLWDKVLG